MHFRKANRLHLRTKCSNQNIGYVYKIKATSLIYNHFWFKILYTHYINSAIYAVFVPHIGCVRNRKNITLYVRQAYIFRSRSISRTCCTASSSWRYVTCPGRAAAGIGRELDHYCGWMLRVHKWLGSCQTDDGCKNRQNCSSFFWTLCLFMLN